MLRTPRNRYTWPTINVDWAATDAAGTETSNGSAEARGNEIVISGQGAYDGRLNVRLSDNPPVHYMPSFAASFAFESAPDSGGNETNETNETNQTTGPIFPDVTLPATVDCGTATFEWDSNATDVLITCTVTNPNPFDVMVGFAWTVVPGTPPPLNWCTTKQMATRHRSLQRPTVRLTLRFFGSKRPNRGHVPWPAG